MMAHLVEPLCGRFESVKREPNLLGKRLCLFTGDLVSNVKTTGDLLVHPFVHLGLDRRETSADLLHLLGHRRHLRLLRLGPTVSREYDLGDGAPVDTV
jgi:hypothetical protein